MEPASFKESNLTLSAPPGLEKEVMPLDVFHGIQHIGDGRGCICFVSCWKVTKEELEEIKRTGRIWISIWSNHMPPICPTAIKPLIHPCPRCGQPCNCNLDVNPLCSHSCPVFDPE